LFGRSVNSFALVQGYGDFIGASVDGSYVSTPVSRGWHQIAYSYDSEGVLILYVDGVAAGSNQFKLNRGLYQEYGGLLAAGSEGLFDEVRMYNRSLSAQEIQLFYQSEFRKYNSTQYRFYVNITNLSSGTYTYYGWANDSAGNSNYTILYDAASPRYLTVLFP